MTSRITRNNATSNLGAENLGAGGKKHVGPAVKGGLKRKVDDENAVPVDQRNKRRAAFEDLTNATTAAGNNLKAHMRKGLTSIVGKGKVTVAKEASKPVPVLAARKTTTSTTAAKKKVKQETESSDKTVTSLEAVTAVPTDIKTEVEVKDEVEVETDNEVAAGKKKYEIVLPPPPQVPEGVIDFDLECGDDPQQHAEYAMETFQYYKNREEFFRIPDYMSAQTDITENMRSILVDWLVEVQESFELNHETLYTAVKMTDLYLSKKQVKKEDLQLVGATACLISCKVDERIPPMVDDFLYVCDDAYSRDQLMRQERKMLQVVGFDVGYSLSYRFLRRYGRVCKVTMPVLTLARYILEFSLMEYKFNVETSESLLAASSLVLAFKIKQIEGWAPTLKYYSGYSPCELMTTVRGLLKMLRAPAKENLKTIRSKYSHKVFHEVALLSVPEDVQLTEEEEAV